MPEIHFSDIDNPSAGFSDAIRKRGVAVVRQVIPEQEARSYKEEIEAYIAANSSTKGQSVASQSNSRSLDLAHLPLCSISARRPASL